jgi:hypothetical protein
MNSQNELREGLACAHFIVAGLDGYCDPCNEILLEVVREDQNAEACRDVITNDPADCVASDTF